MSLLRIFLTAILFVLLTGSSFGAEKPNLQPHQTLGEALADGFTKLVEQIETSPEEYNKWMNITSELNLFINYISQCLNALPLPEHGTISIFPTLNSIEINPKFPLSFKIEIHPKDEDDHFVVLMANKKSISANWKLSEGWLKTISGTKENISLPSPLIQDKANMALPCLMKEKEKCKCE